MNINQMKRKDFERLPHRKWDEDIGEFDSLVILPLRKKHDSGFRLMDFVAVKDDKPTCLLSGCSDVIHIEGIGGYGLNWNPKYGGVPRLVPPVGWSIDCLATSGLLRLFHHGNIKVGTALSSFEIYQVKEDK